MNYKIFLCLLLPVFFYQCNDIEKYYERPGWLAKPIYEVLEQEGRFSNYLQCVDSTEYALVLKGAGLYTVLPPTMQLLQRISAKSRMPLWMKSLPKNVRI